MFSYIVLLVYCQLKANTTERLCMKISRNVVSGTKRNN